MIIATVMRGRLQQAADSEYERVAKRIVRLAKSERLESQGDLSNWRGSEVRLMDGLPSLTSSSQDEGGNAHESIELLQAAVSEESASLPNLYRLAVLLMDTERWLDANTVLEELIRLSE